jgi:hypothetical protein
MNKRLNIKNKLLFQKNIINKKRVILKSILFLIINYLYIIIFKIFKNGKSNIIMNNKNNINMKVCICTLGKSENRYIREYVQHYEIYGVDKIFLYDNNDINGERFDEVIKDYIDRGFVKILNWRGEIKAIYKIMNDCYTKNNNNYNWLIFYELDEFIHLYKNKSIKEFLGQKIFAKCQVIYLNFVQHTDNNLLFYENKSLALRFPEVEPNAKKKIGVQSIKSIIRGNISKLKINHIHFLSRHLKYCNGFGNKDKFVNYRQTRPDYKYNYIDHYYSKSTEEFINKVNRGDAYSLSLKYKMDKVKKYFLQSKITLEKIKLIENGTGLNLTMYKKIF